MIIPLCYYHYQCVLDSTDTTLMLLVLSLRLVPLSPPPPLAPPACSAFMTARCVGNAGFKFSFGQVLANFHTFWIQQNTYGMLNSPVVMSTAEFRQARVYKCCITNCTKQNNKEVWYGRPST